MDWLRYFQIVFSWQLYHPLILVKRSCLSLTILHKTNYQFIFSAYIYVNENIQYSLWYDFNRIIEMIPMIRWYYLWYTTSVISRGKCLYIQTAQRVTMRFSMANTNTYDITTTPFLTCITAVHVHVCSWEEKLFLQNNNNRNNSLFWYQPGLSSFALRIIKLRHMRKVGGSCVVERRNLTLLNWIRKWLWMMFSGLENAKHLSLHAQRASMWSIFSLGQPYLAPESFII